jgi:hypothetical protein
MRSLPGFGYKGLFFSVKIHDCMVFNKRENANMLAEEVESDIKSLRIGRLEWNVRG